MRLSTRTRYGVRLMLDLAIKYGKGSVLLKDIAKSQDVSEKYLSQVIIPLRQAGLVTSVRGVHGGYSLSREPNKINVKDIPEALEGDLSLVDCLTNPKVCKRMSLCATQELWRDLNKVILDTLEKVSLQDLKKRADEKAQKTASYDI